MKLSSLHYDCGQNGYLLEAVALPFLVVGAFVVCRLVVSLLVVVVVGRLLGEGEVKGWTRAPPGHKVVINISDIPHKMVYSDVRENIVRPKTCLFNVLCRMIHDTNNWVYSEKSGTNLMSEQLNIHYKKLICQICSCSWDTTDMGIHIDMDMDI